MQCYALSEKDRRLEGDVRRLIDDPRFRAYHRELLKPREFNTFDVLQYADYEIRHSNVLAWLLQPGDTHGIGARFLKWFVDQIDKRTVFRQSALRRRMSPSGESGTTSTSRSCSR